MCGPTKNFGRIGLAVLTFIGYKTNTQTPKDTKYIYRRKLTQLTLSLIISNLFRTGLPTKDETSETTVRNIYCLFITFMILCNCKFVSLLVK